MIRIWTGFHEADLREFVEDALSGNGLLVLCPPRLRDFSFLDLLPSGEIELPGHWTPEERTQLGRPRMSRDDYPERPILGVFTSGTLSGSPRLVLYSRRNVTAALTGILRFFDTERLDSIFCFPQPFHTFGLVLGYVLAGHLRLPLLAEPGPYRSASLELWRSRVRPGMLTLGTPTHFHDLVRSVRVTGQPPRPSYSAIIGGAPVPVQLWHDVREILRIAAPSIGYGCTEASPGLTHLEPGLPPTTEGEIGRPLHNVALTVHPGQGIEFRGDGLCLAMIEQGKLVFPESLIVPDDIERGEDGRLVYHGRIGLQLNRGGVKFSLEGLETELHAILGVSAACFALPDDRLGEDLGIVAEGEDPALFARIRDFLWTNNRIRLEAGRFRLVQRLPVTANGKRDRPAAMRWLRDDSP